MATFTTQVSPLATGTFAMGVGGILLLLSAYKSLFKDIKKLRNRPLLLLTGGLSIAVYPLAFYTSMHWSGVAIGTVISIASAPFFSFY
ncbi:hypothetical protein RS130_06860 [Paraglaciecola aquimarina]|uniref:EamA domain-containing protein n=1 Tax=Paraglaciecola aquimarina TaxID=1235557 RepID=A0ABU3SUJ0_9ALTE|nr:hypothetical protein [Paraglaciecola aquimarina]MDU0353684.1 hypothetical protein [Paraglaciecola aquimarina]